MKLRRTSLGSIGFAIVICAVDFAVIRAAFADDGPDEMQFVLLLLPMIDLLLVRLYRLRKPRRRTARALGFCLAGMLATAALVTTSFVAGEAVYDLLRSITHVVALPTIDALTRLCGNAAMQTLPMRLTLAITFELLLPVAFFCLPPLAVARLGGRLGHRYRPAQPDAKDARTNRAIESGPPIVAGTACPS